MVKEDIYNKNSIYIGISGEQTKIMIKITRTDPLPTLTLQLQFS